MYMYMLDCQREVIHLKICFISSAIVEEPKEQEEENPEEETRKNLAFLLEKVEGCSVSWRF